MRRPFVRSATASEADTSSTTARYAALPIQGGSYSDTLLHRLHITTYWAPFFLMNQGILWCSLKITEENCSSTEGYSSVYFGIRRYPLAKLPFSLVLVC